MPSPSGATGRGMARVVNQGQNARIRPSNTDALPRIQFSTGKAGALRSLSNDLFATSDRLEDQLDERAQAEAQVEGATAGALGEFEIQDYGTIRGRAYNQAGIQTTIARIETNGLVKKAELESMYGSDPVKLQAELEAYHNGVVGEIDAISPGAGQLYRQRQTTAALPAIERAKDNAFNLTKDQAEAALLQNTAAINDEIARTGADLFSENPARSEAAMQQIGLLQQSALRIYDAVDPVTGRPLYTAAQKAAAKIKFNDQVAETAAVSWFEQQDDKVGAYLKFTQDGFPVEFNVSPSKVNIIEATDGKIRSKPITDTVRNQLGYAASQLGEGVEVKVVSGGQDPVGSLGIRTGSTRHDHGNAGDVVLVVNGREVTPVENPQLYADFIEGSASAGATGIGVYPWGVHIGGGKKAAWGADKRSASLHPNFRAAVERGWENPIDPNGGKRKVDLFSGISEGARKRIESEMRSQITFKNQIVDREERIAEKADKEKQEATAFDFADRLYNGGTEIDGVKTEKLTRQDILGAVRRQELSPNQGEAFLKALVAPTTKSSDRTVYDEINRRIYDGEDVNDFIVSNFDKLTASDASALMAKNHTLNIKGDGSLSNEQTFQQKRIEDLLTPDTTRERMDPSLEPRKFAALDEYRMRISEGENARDVANDIAERATREMERDRRSLLNKKLTPRFSVPGAEPGTIDVQATKKALNAALQSKRISRTSYERQAKLLLEWHTIQQGSK